MPSRLWREQLEKELRRRALPAAYRLRLIEELADHQLDMEARLMSMDALTAGSIESRLGDPRLIAKEAATVYRRNFVQRRPLICFVAGPLVGFPIAFIATLALGFPLINGALGLVGLDMEALAASPQTVNRLMHGFAWCLRLIPFAAAALFFVYLAKRARQDYRWPIVAILLVSLLAAGFHAQVVDKLSGAQGNFSVGLSFPISGPMAYLQVAAPLALAVYVFLRRKTYGSAQLAS